MPFSLPFFQLNFRRSEPWLGIYRLRTGLSFTARQPSGSASYGGCSFFFATCLGHQSAQTVVQSMYHTLYLIYHLGYSG